MESHSMYSLSFSVAIEDNCFEIHSCYCLHSFESHRVDMHRLSTHPPAVGLWGCLQFWILN